MKCELCKKPNPKLIVLLPLRQSNGNLDTMACEECAKKSIAYCKKHQRPHIGFIDGTTACPWCVEELVTANTDKAANIYRSLQVGLPPEQVDDLEELAELGAQVAGCSDSIAILRLVASKALRTNQKVEEVVRTVTSGDSLNYLIWK